MALDYVAAFQDFWIREARYDAMDNPARTFNNILEKLSQCHTIADIDDYICGLKSARESSRRLMLRFYAFLEKNYDQEIETTLQDLVFYDYPFQRQLEIAKYLHEPHTRAEIREHFAIGDSTLGDDLRALRDGIEVLGATIQISEERAGRKIYYRTTMHPVFLPLNLTEVYALTVYLEHILKGNDPNAQVLRSISNRIKGQLSDYALNRLFPGQRFESANHYVDDEQLARSREGILMYLMKSGQYCSFYLNGVKQRGRIIQGEGPQWYQIQLEDGTLSDADPREAEFILDMLEYH